MQPYLLAFCDRGEKTLGRSVLTAVMHVGPQQTLFVTCKHVISKLTDLFMVDERGQVRVNRWGLILTTTVDLDLIFIMVRDDVPTNRIKVNESRINKNTQLSHARNEYRTNESPLTIHSTVAKPSPFKAAMGLAEDKRVVYEFIRSDAAFEDAKRRDRTLYNVLEMESWPGVSGSALWDKYGAIRGMVCSGDKETSRLEDGLPRLIYLPAKTIMKEAARALKDPKVLEKIRQ